METGMETLTELTKETVKTMYNNGDGNTNGNNDGGLETETVITMSTVMEKTMETNQRWRIRMETLTETTLRY